MVNVLLIDDDLASQKVYAAGLEKAGHTVATGVDGRALEALDSDSVPDLIITDILMPETDGFEVLGALKRNFPGLPVIVISGSIQYLEIAEALGASSTLLKPFTINQLLEAVEKALFSNAG